MTTPLESRLWLALHLLYPNSSQAFDVYQAMVSQAGKALEKDDRISVFSKLALILDKIPPVSSNLSFYEFSLEEIDQWKILYKSSQKSQLLVFVGVLIFDLKISEIAPFVNLPQEKVQFHFHQMFKKLVKNNLKTKFDDSGSSKKQNELKISYLYTYENLIEYCLGQLPEVDVNKVKIGLELYPALQTIKNEYLKIINQIQNLKVQRSQFVKSKNKFILVRTVDGAEDTENPINENKKFYVNTKILASVVTISALTAFMLFQFTDIFNQFRNADQGVIIQQIEKKRTELIEQPEIAQESIPSDPEVEDESEETEIPDEAVEQIEQHVTIKQNKLEKLSESKKIVLNENLKSVEKKQPEKQQKNLEVAEYKGGLYRGTLIVNNLEIDNQKIRSKLLELGAKKAGEVELGWYKSKKMAYYHFTILEKNTAEFENYLKQLGKLGIKYETHPRLIPLGTKRFIIEVKGEM